MVAYAFYRSDEKGKIISLEYYLREEKIQKELPKRQSQIWGEAF
jgi:hypothetical protein